MINANARVDSVFLICWFNYNHLVSVIHLSHLDLQSLKWITMLICSLVYIYCIMYMVSNNNVYYFVYWHLFNSLSCIFNIAYTSVICSIKLLTYVPVYVYRHCRTTFAVRSTRETTSEGDNTENSQTHNSRDGITLRCWWTRRRLRFTSSRLTFSKYRTVQVLLCKQ